MLIMIAFTCCSKSHMHDAMLAWCLYGAWGPFSDMELFLLPAWMNNYIHFECRMQLRIQRLNLGIDK